MKNSTKIGYIKSLIYASSTGENSAISCKMFLKGEFNAWNYTVRMVASKSNDTPLYEKLKDTINTLVKQAGVSSPNELSGKKIECIFNKESLVDFKIIA